MAVVFFFVFLEGFGGLGLRFWVLGVSGFCSGFLGRVCAVGRTLRAFGRWKARKDEAFFDFNQASTWGSEKAAECPLKMNFALANVSFFSWSLVRNVDLERHCNLGGQDKLLQCNSSVRQDRANGIVTLLEEIYLSTCSPYSEDHGRFTHGRIDELCK